MALSLLIVPGAGASEQVAHTSKAKSLRSLQKSIASLDRTIKRQSKALGRANTRKLRRSVAKARASARRRKLCPAVRSINAITVATKRFKGAERTKAGATLAPRSRKLTDQLFERARPRGCGLKAPKVLIQARLRPKIAALPPRNGVPQPLARVGDGDGGADFVQDQLIVHSSNAGQVARLTRRLRGRILEVRKDVAGKKDMYLLLVKARSTKGKALTADLRSLDPASRGTIGVSNQTALNTIAAAADAATKGMTVGANFIPEPASLADRQLTEGASTLSDVRSPNPFAWPYMQKGGPLDIGTTEAWRALYFAGRIPTGGARPGIFILDGGFRSTPDVPAGSSMPVLNTPNSSSCTAGSTCNYHGTAVAATAAGVVDNAYGTAGAGGPVAKVSTAQYTGVFDIGYMLWDIIVGTAPSEFVNLSATFELDAGVSFLAAPMSAVTGALYHLNKLVFAAAGNTNQDVDDEDCFIACWEEEVIAPCELASVICVAGLADAARTKHRSSSYGKASCGRPPCDVEIAAPYTVFIQNAEDPLPLANNWTRGGGTSYSSPYMAGVAALVWAAGVRSNRTIERILLESAHTAYGDISRYVNAYSAVRRALGTRNYPPHLKIQLPEGPTLSRAIGQRATFKAETGDVEAESCCVIRWSSNVDGSLGSGSLVNKTFTSPGTRVVTASVTDTAGATTTRSVTVNVSAPPANSPPLVTLDAPVPGAVLAKDVQTLLSSTVTPTDADPVTSTLWFAQAGAQSPVQIGAVGAFNWRPDASPLPPNCGEQNVFLTVEATDNDGTGFDSVPIVVNWGPC